MFFNNNTERYYSLPVNILFNMLIKFFDHDKILCYYSVNIKYFTHKYIRSRILINQI